MGIDVGIRKVAYSIWDDRCGEWQLVDTEAYETNAPTRHNQLLDLSDLIYEAVQHVAPDHVFIEDTLVGNNVKYSLQLTETKGAILYNLGLYCAEEMLGVYMVNVSTWKAKVIGSGRADKDRVRSWLLSRDSAYSVLCGDDQDRFDAACIGYYGCLISDASEVFA